MKTTFTDYGWETKTVTVTRKYYHVKYIGKLMLVHQWVETSERLFPKDTRRKKCEFCKTDWQDKPIIGNVNLVIFKKEHRNKTICDDCRCKILKKMEMAKQMAQEFLPDSAVVSDI